MVGAWRCTEQQQQPGALEGGLGGEAARQADGVPPAAARLSRLGRSRRAPVGHHDPALGRRLIAAPNIVTQLSDAGRRRAFFGGHRPGFAKVGPYATVVSHGLGGSIQRRARAAWGRDEQVVQESHQGVPSVQAGSRALQSVMLPQCVQRWGERVALLAPLSLPDFPVPPGVVPPAVRGRGGRKTCG